MLVSALVEEVSVGPEEVILSEGEEPRHLFVVVDGHATAQVELERGWVCLGLITPGDVAGWSALVDSPEYPASVKALTPMRLARIEATGLRLLMNLEPQIGYPVNSRLSSILFRQYEAALQALKTSG
jgi:CRP-like cAMP-binding protein